jgi:glycosyltransferase involved in cell wall biosynthesis
VTETAISVIIPVRNEGQRIVQTVQSLFFGRSSSFPLEIVVVDDASTDGSCAKLIHLAENIRNASIILRRLKKWSGIPFARNRGAEAAHYPIFVMTDGNARFLPGWDIHIRRNFHRSRLLAGTIIDMASSFRGHGCTLLLPSMGVKWLHAGAYGGYVPVTTSACTVIDRCVFHHLGGYDESLPLYGAAEPEFSVRAWLNGYEIINVPELWVYHRFRPKREYDAFRNSISDVLISNYLRFACYYLPQDLLMQAYQHYSTQIPDDFDSCMGKLVASGVWSRREQLHRTLPLNMSWLINRFGLTSAKLEVPA